MNAIVELPLSLLNKNGGKLSLLLFSAACFGAILNSFLLISSGLGSVSKIPTFKRVSFYCSILTDFLYP